MTPAPHPRPTTHLSAVLDDLRAHHPTTSRQVAERLGLPHKLVSEYFGTLSLRKQAFGVRVRGAYVWSPVPVFDLPPLPEQTPTQIAARQATAATKRRQCEARTEELVALMRSRAPRRTSLADVCRALGWAQTRAVRHMEILVRTGRAQRTTPMGVAGLWRWCGA